MNQSPLRGFRTSVEVASSNVYTVDAVCDAENRWTLHLSSGINTPFSIDGNAGEALVLCTTSGTEINPYIQAFNSYDDSEWDMERETLMREAWEVVAAVKPLLAD